MTPYNYLKQMQQAPKNGGEGIKREITFNPNALAVSGATRAVTSSVDRVIFDAADESVIVNFAVPRDYDEDADELKVSLYVEYISGTSVQVDFDVATRCRAGAALAAITPTDPAAYTIDAAADNGWKQFDLSGNDLLAGDILALEFDAAAVTGSGIVHILGARVQYKSTIVFSDPAAR